MAEQVLREALATSSQHLGSQSNQPLIHPPSAALAKSNLVAAPTKKSGVQGNE